MIHARVYDEKGRRDISAAEISERRDGDNGLLWVDVDDATEEDLATIGREFDLHPLAIEDARKHGQRPKLEQYPSHAFLVAYSKELAEVDLFVGPTWIISVRDRAPDGSVCDLAPIEERLARTEVGVPTVGFVLYTILDQLVDGYFDAAEDAEDALEALEDKIFSEAGTGADERQVQQELFGVRRRLLLFRRAIVPLREVIAALLRREVPWLTDDETLTHLQDVFDHVLRAVDQVDGQRELMGNAVDAHLAIISNRMNQVMKKMTSWGAILLGSTLIAGIEGMNFDHMPELHTHYGYPMALGSMVLITIALYWYFRNKEWL